MSNIIQRSIAIGQRHLQRLSRVSVTYVRTSGTRIPISCRKAIVRDEQLGNMDRPVRVDRWRFTFEANDLVDGGQVVRPEEGDQIHQVVGTKRTIYRATPPKDDEPCWGWNDSDERELFVDMVEFGKE